MNNFAVPKGVIHTKRERDDTPHVLIASGIPFNDTTFFHYSASSKAS